MNKLLLLEKAIAAANAAYNKAIDAAAAEYHESKKEI